MIYTHAAAALLAAVVAATGTYKIQEWRYGAKEAEHAKQHLADERAAAATTIRRLDNVIAAQNAAAVRDATLRRDAAGARAAADGLRSATDQTLRDAAASLDACLERANTLGELFVTVEEAGRGMAEKAGLHASDVKTLTDAWPK